MTTLNTRTEVNRVAAATEADARAAEAAKVNDAVTESELRNAGRMRPAPTYVPDNQKSDHLGDNQEHDTPTGTERPIGDAVGIRGLHDNKDYARNLHRENELARSERGLTQPTVRAKAKTTTKVGKRRK